MLRRTCRLRGICIHQLHIRAEPLRHHRGLLTLAIETSCDDTSVAVVEKHAFHPKGFDHGRNPAATLHFHEKITANNLAHRGIHPVVALESHQANLAILVAKAIKHLPEVADEVPAQSSLDDVHNGFDRGKSRKPDFVSVTRGPGMRASLSTGLNTAKGLAVAWQVPMLGVNHMQAHALTPRLVAALAQDVSAPPDPAFPFLSLLVSGGHTLLVLSKGLSEHKILATTADIAIGDAIDKVARLLLPQDQLESSEDVMYGSLLEKFVFPDGFADHHYSAPATKGDETARKQSKWGWALCPPFAETRSGSKTHAMGFSFTGLGSSIRRRVDTSGNSLGIPERIDLAREAMRICFEHLASRIVLALRALALRPSDAETIDTLVVSGGVAANGYLRTVLRAFLDIRGFPQVRILFPPSRLCTDNAAMIGWTGIEMFEDGWESTLSCRPLRKWSIDPDAEDGGILGATDWSYHQ